MKSMISYITTMAKMRIGNTSLIAANKLIKATILNNKRMYNVK